jgi:hypothetical protein
MTQNGVIEIATGDLLRAGFCDFSSDGTFDAEKEEYRTDVPFPAVSRGSGAWHRWNGGSWVVVSDLTVAKKGRLSDLKTAVTEYIGAHYDQGQQSTLNALWIEGISKGWPNRKAKVQLVMDWVNAVLAYFYQKKDAILAAADQAALDAVDVDFSQFDDSDPEVSVEAVILVQD